MVLVVLAVVGLSYYAVVIANYGPELMEGGSRTLWALVVLIIFHVLLVMLLWCYFAVVLTDPGEVPPGWRPSAEELDLEGASATVPLTCGAGSMDLVGGTVGGYISGTGSLARLDIPSTVTSSLSASATDGFPSPVSGTPGPPPVVAGDGRAAVGAGTGHERVRYCRKCCAYKPPRCHHCSVCGRCVLKMDHHCIWVANCVGACNYKFFLLFLVYTMLETSFVSIVLLPQSIAFFKNGDADGPGAGIPGRAGTTFLGFVFNLAFALSVLSFLLMHLSLVSNNTTTIEAYEKNISSRWRYDIGRRRNWEQVFGMKKWSWILPVYDDDDLRRMPALHGLDFPCRTDVDTQEY
ncbi:hypothetical protein CBR_g54190 [Chara braunii]|uniref:S-acyltransferase n=1 Tax=Chara braunii TaxID=69332 RepID=A0A388K797_CHABU|nr:hypothetical protein CBR_g54190 [Chara braunii]|eukprot:GBG65899.1 hypothetical protein CBR_g54190 [Chara braunii]